MNASSFSFLLQHFFTDRLFGQLNASPHTVTCYRDAFRLLFLFAKEHLGRSPSGLRLEEFDVPFLGKFLEYLELERHNCTRTRNNRLSALQAFFRYVSLKEPALALHCQRILAIPAKRYERCPVEFLTEEEASALIAAPEPDKWIGRRDRAILLVAIQTGLRNSEITSLLCEDVQFGTGAHVHCLGKGRKMRCTPLRPDVATVLKEWLIEQDGNPKSPVFPSSRGTRLSADALQRLVVKHTAVASRSCPSLKDKKVTPHTLRHYGERCKMVSDDSKPAKPADCSSIHSPFYHWRPSEIRKSIRFLSSDQSGSSVVGRISTYAASSAFLLVSVSALA